MNGKNATETQKKKKIGAVYRDGNVIEHIQSGMWSSVLEVSCWTMPHSQVDQFKLISNKLRH